MIGYSGTKVFDSEAMKLLHRAESMVAAIPDEEGLRCHEVARAVGRSLGLKVVDGKYGPVDHSWILIERPMRRPFILDPYAVGRLPVVQLVDNYWNLPHWAWYTDCGERDDVDEKTVLELMEIFGGLT